MKVSAGLLVYRGRGRSLEMLLVHPGGPLWARRDAGAWSIPKGEATAGEDLLAAARREFAEEIGEPVHGAFFSLGSVTQRGGKVVHAWAIEGDLDPETIASNTFEMEWPPRSGRRQSYPEIDRAAWFDAATVRMKVNPAQQAFVDRLQAHLDESGPGNADPVGP